MRRTKCHAAPGACPVYIPGTGGFRGCAASAGASAKFHRSNGKRDMSIFKRKPKPQAAAVGDAPVPVHIAIIMDGNGRWAKQRGLPRHCRPCRRARRPSARIANYCQEHRSAVPDGLRLLHGELEAPGGGGGRHHGPAGANTSARQSLRTWTRTGCDSASSAT